MHHIVDIVCLPKDFLEIQRLDETTGSENSVE